MSDTWFPQSPAAHPSVLSSVCDAQVSTGQTLSLQLEVRNVRNDPFSVWS